MIQGATVEPHLSNIQNAELSGRLLEVIVNKNRTTGLFREEVRTHLPYGRYFIVSNF